MATPGNHDHLLLEPAQVFILAGAETRYDRAAWDYHTTDAWSLWSIVDGTVDLTPADGPRQRLTAPVLLCMQPGGGEMLTIPTGTTFRRLVLALRWTPRHILHEGNESRACALEGAMQPTASAWFGRDLPTVVGAPHQAAGMAVVERACRDWWRGDLRRLRASAEVAAWLYDWVLGLEQGTDGWDHLERLARERLAQGIDVAGLAVACGITRSTLLRRLRGAGQGTPRAWLDNLREEEARRLLGDGLAVRDVARRCGFRSAAAFARWFHHRVGQPPSLARPQR